MQDSDNTLIGYILLFVATLLVVWGFHYENQFVDVQYSDVAFHLSVLKSLSAAAQRGQSILDFWYDGVPYGFALFRSYQYLPYLAMYAIYKVCGEHYSLAQVLFGCTFALATILPTSIFYSLRMLGVRVLEAGIAALLSVLISDGAEYGMGLQNYTYGTVGITTQLWAMVFLAPAIACSFQYLHYRKNLGLALLLGFLTFGSHVVAAVILISCILVFSIGEILQTRKFFKAPVILLSLLAVITAHQWFFVMSDSLYINRSLLEPAWKYQGHGTEALIQLMWQGDFFDASRYPVLTALFLISFCYVVVYYKKVAAQAGGDYLKYCIFLFLLFFSFCAGRELWGIFDILPVFKNLHLHRFATGAHLFAIFIISIALADLVRTVSTSTARQLLVVFLLFVLFRPALNERIEMFKRSYQLHRDTANIVDKDSDLKNLLNALDQQPYGWTYTGSKTSWQGDLLVAGYVPLDLFTVMRGIPTVGGILYHSLSLAGETLFDFNPFNSTHFDLFGIRNVVAPLNWKGAPGFTNFGNFGRYALWGRESRMIYVADDRFEPIVQDEHRSVAVRTFVQDFNQFKDIRGVIVQQKIDNPQNFSGKAIMREAGKVVAAIGYHPNWKVEVDQNLVDAQWVLPGLVGVNVPAGEHAISFRYEGSRLKFYLLLLGIVTIIATIWRERCGKARV